MFPFARIPCWVHIVDPQPYMIIYVYDWGGINMGGFLATSFCAPLDSLEPKGGPKMASKKHATTKHAFLRETRETQFSLLKGGPLKLSLVAEPPDWFPVFAQAVVSCEGNWVHFSSRNARFKEHPPHKMS